MTELKRFSLRQGIEKEPDHPIFEDAPERLRYFTLAYLQNNFFDFAARETIARVLCIPDLITESGLVGLDCWQRLQVHIFACDWWQLYNILENIYIDLPKMHNGTFMQAEFIKQVNRTFSEESIGWKMDPQGQLQRLLPEIIRAQEETIFKELRVSRFAAAFGHLQTSREAYNSRPRRDREVCSEIFDALESVAKEIFSIPTGTFGDVIKAARQRKVFASETFSVLEKIYALANSHFRHGMTEPFTLTEEEVDFVYLNSLAGIMLFLRFSQH